MKARIYVTLWAFSFILMMFVLFLGVSNARAQAPSVGLALDGKVADLEASIAANSRLTADGDRQLADALLQALERIKHLEARVQYLEASLPDPSPAPTPDPQPTPNPTPTPGDGPTIFTIPSPAPVGVAVRLNETIPAPRGLEGIGGTWYLDGCNVRSSYISDSGRTLPLSTLINAGNRQLSVYAHNCTFEQIPVTPGKPSQATVRIQNVPVGTKPQDAVGVAMFEDCTSLNSGGHKGGRFYGLRLVFIYGGHWDGPIDIGLHPDDPRSDVGVPCARVILAGRSAEDPLVIDSRESTPNDVPLRMKCGNQNVTIGPHVRFKANGNLAWIEAAMKKNIFVEVLHDVTINGTVIEPRTYGSRP